MPRPIKGRRVGFIPEVTYFKPTGIPMHLLENVALSLEELEAIRLKDQDGLQQEECAELMAVSRPTFHRVLSSARAKIADALINGKAIRIEGGNFEMVHHRFRCGWDGHEWEISAKGGQEVMSQPCPKCRRRNTKQMGDSPKGADGSECRRRRWLEAQSDGSTDAQP